MASTDIGKWADYLVGAVRRNEAVPAITDVEPALSAEDGYAIQDEVLAAGIDLTLAGCLFEENGAIATTAAGAAILGHPATAVAKLANFLGQRGRQLEAGWIILSGCLTAARALAPDSQFVATFAHLDRVGITAEA
jgi:2-oxo-3-hexenedioate decarboxylase